MNETYEKEINLKWLVYRALRSWKRALVWAVLVGLVLGFGSIGLSAINLLDAEFMDKAELDFEREHAAWVATEKNYQVQLDNLAKAKARQQEYNEKSIMMKINPLQKWVASLQIYLNYDYKVNPNLTVQPPDRSNSILSDYHTYMTNGDMYKYIMDRVDYDYELRYFTEIFSVSVDYGNNFITVSVVHENADACEEILAYARQAIEARTEDVAARVDEHTLSVSNESIYDTIDLGLQDQQEKNRQYITDIDRSIQSVNLARLEWEKGETEEGEEIKGGGPEPKFEYTWWNAFKSGVKMGIIGGVVTVVLWLVCVAVGAVLSGKLINPEDMKSRFGLHLIGQLPSKRKAASDKISAIIARIGGINARAEEYEMTAKMIGASIKSDLQARNLNGKTVAFVGTAPVKEMMYAVSSMGISGYSVVCAPNILTDATSVEKVAAADCVVLVEKQEKTVVSDIEKELAALKVWNKPLLGAVVLNTDTIA